MRPGLVALLLSCCLSAPMATAEQMETDWFDEDPPVERQQPAGNGKNPDDGETPSTPQDKALRKNYHLGVGDKVRIIVEEEPDLSVVVWVSLQGTIKYPFLGEVPIAGLTVEGVEKTIRDRLADGYLLNPVVAVHLLKYRLFYIHGQVKNPGGYPLRRGMNVDQALEMAGGMIGSRRENRITVSRGTEVDKVESIIDVGEPVMAGDILKVEKRRKAKKTVSSRRSKDGLMQQYLLGAGDRIQIKVDDEPELTAEAKISGEGTINYFFLGEIEVANRSAREVEEILREKLSNGFLLNPEVFVTVLEYRMYYVHGEVEKAGGYPFQPGLTTRKAIVLAGGFTDFANEDRVNVIRGSDPEHKEETIGLDEPVFPGDIITVMESFW